jgi:hypothetical protein
MGRGLRLDTLEPYHSYPHFSDALGKFLMTVLIQSQLISKDVVALQD